MTSRRARQHEQFERAKRATQLAAEADAAEQEELRRKMESGKKKPPARLSRREVALARRMDESGDSVKPKKRWLGK